MQNAQVCTFAALKNRFIGSVKYIVKMHVEPSVKAAVQEKVQVVLLFSIIMESLSEYEMNKNNATVDTNILTVIQRRSKNLYIQRL